MCGINGFCDFGQSVKREENEKATQSLHHRGPDDGESLFFSVHLANIGLGHRRLSILDLSNLGHQPMHSDDKNVVIVLNGEIYNFREIRETLIKKGHQFISTSDTEVVIKAYLEYGIDCVKEFIGMFAFVLFDKRIQKMFLCRDRAGVKPLYYYFDGKCFLFASELKAFHHYSIFKKEIEPEAVSLFFSYGYIKEPLTIFRNTHKLSPGHYAVLDIACRQLQLTQYWNVADYYNKPVIKVDEVEALEQMEELLTSAFEYRMVSDVPVGIFLSGGYDSSLVTALLQKNTAYKIKTFTIGFKEEKYNEAYFAKKVAEHLGTDHNELYCSVQDALQIIPALPFYYDEPFGDSSAIPTMLVSKFARQQVKVALSADAGDEIFAGYARYDQLTQIKRLRQYIPPFAGRAFSKLLQYTSSNPRYGKLGELLQAKQESDLSDSLSRHFTLHHLGKLFPASGRFDNQLTGANNLNADRDFINSILAKDYRTYLSDDILTKVDRATMSVGLEGRDPLLDHRIVEWAARLPQELKYRNGSKKYLLKKLTHRYIPESIMNRPKMGFGIPVNRWLQGELKPLVMDTVNKKNLQKHCLLNEDAVIKLRDRYLHRTTSSDSLQLWLVLMFQMWWNYWME